MVVAFDLDDTLMPELRFVESAVSEIGLRHSLRRHLLPGETLAGYFDYTGLDIETLLTEYRTHAPVLIPVPWPTLYALETLLKSGAHLYLVTDGRSHTQRAKINALRLDRWFSPQNIYISEEVGECKTSGWAFRDIASRHPGEHLWMVGDNPQKDFAASSEAGFSTVCLRDAGENIHSQNFELLEAHYKPDFVINNLYELPDLVV